MSCLVTRPAYPLPGIREMSTLCSAAILRTRGVDLVRRRCSAVWTPPPSPLLTGAGASDLGAGGAGVGPGCPTFWSPLPTVLSATGSPSCGRKPPTGALVVAAGRRRRGGGLHNIVRRREPEVLEGRGVRQGHMMGGHPHDGSAEPLECLF